MKDFSHILNPNEASLELSQYFAKVCGKCGGMCCSYNISPIDHNFTLSYNLNEDNMVVLKKALILSKDYRIKFFRNVIQSLKYFEKKGFGKGLPDYVRTNKFSLRAIVKAYRLINKRIDAYNAAILRDDPLDMNYKVINDCLFLIPRFGCILGEHRPFTCVTAFRNCFVELELSRYVESRVHKVNDERELLKYLREDFRLGEHTLPRVIIGGSSDFIKKATLLATGKKTASVGDLTDFQLAVLCDFITFPFSKPHKCIEDRIEQSKFYIMKKIKEPPSLTFADSLTFGVSDNSFNFGLDYVEVFEIVG